MNNNDKIAKILLASTSKKMKIEDALEQLLDIFNKRISTKVHNDNTKIAKILALTTSKKMKFEDAHKQLQDLFNQKITITKISKKEKTLLNKTEENIDLNNVKTLKPKILFKVEMDEYKGDVYLLANGYDEAAETALKIKNGEEEKKDIIDEDGCVTTPQKTFKVKRVELITKNLYNL